MAALPTPPARVPPNRAPVMNRPPQGDRMPTATYTVPVTGIDPVA